jgi:hypothetical protein
MLLKRLASVFAYTLLALGLAAGNASANCADPNYGWNIATAPAVNVRHIFCGAIVDLEAKGYHSRVYPPPTSVVTNMQDLVLRGNGIYQATVLFNGVPPKMSTFFPNACNQTQIIASIRYASANSAPSATWRIGLSAPNVGAAGYCLDSNNTPFMIRYGVNFGTTDINTAFPN